MAKIVDVFINGFNIFIYIISFKDVFLADFI